jgi:hypothetical protein
MRNPVLFWKLRSSTHLILINLDWDWLLSIHTLSHGMHVLGLERILLDHYKPKTCIIWSKVCLIVYKKWIKQRAANKKKKKKVALLYCLQ